MNEPLQHLVIHINNPYSCVMKLHFVILIPSPCPNPTELLLLCCFGMVSLAMTISLGTLPFLLIISWKEEGIKCLTVI